MPNGSYSWLPVTTAVQQLAQRLNDPNMIFWVYDELLTYITRSLQQYNSLCWAWRADFSFVNAGPSVWSNLGSISGSPRQRTLTDQDIYAELEYLLLEPSNNTSTWTGTNQFNLSVISQALQRRRDEMLQITNCGQSLLSGIPLVPNTTRTLLPQTVIDVERVRYIPVAIPPATPPPPTTLYRDDTIAQEFYEAPLYQQAPGTPQTFSLSSEPPLSWQVDIPPALPGTYEAVVLQSGAPFVPPASTLIGIPNDFVWVLEFGALADLLGQEQESTDRERSAYALQRYQDGLQLMLKTPWIELGKINGQAVSLDSIVATDRYSPEWDSNPTGFGPVIVVGGIDFIASPVGSSTGMTVLGNAPIVDAATGTFLQVSQSDWDAVILLAHCRSLFKLGGAEWKEGLELEKAAIQMCASENVRLKSQGCFADILDQRGLQQERDMNRYSNARGNKA